MSELPFPCPEGYICLFSAYPAWVLVSVVVLLIGFTVFMFIAVWWASR